MLSLTFATGAPAPVTEGGLVQTWCTETGEVYAAAYAADDRRWVHWPGLATFAFAAGTRHVSAWLAPGASPDVVEDTFFRVLQPVVLQAIGWQALHASAVSVGAHVVALCGKSGAGKSTLAYALGRHGEQWADDAVVWEGNGPVAALGLPFSPRLRASARRHFRQHEIHAGTRPGVRRRPLAAVLVLDQQPNLPEEVRCRRLTIAGAFQQLLTHAHCFDPADPIETRRLVEDYSAFAAVVPVYALSYRPAFDELPAVMRAVRDVLPADQCPPGPGRDGMLAEEDHAVYAER